MGFVIWIITGAVIGWVAGKLMKRKGGFLRNILVGIAGSSLGGFLAGLVHIRGVGIGSFLISVAGACLLLWLAKKLFG